MATLEPPTAPIVDACRLGGSLAFSVDNALTLSVIREHGHETAEDMERLQELLDRSHASAGSHLRSLELVRDPVGHVDRGQASRLRVRHHLRDEQRIRLRLPPRQHAPCVQGR